MAHSHHSSDRRKPQLRDLDDPLVVMAFSGWNDAGSAATDAAAHLAEVSRAELVFGFDPEEFYDFQVNRPSVSHVADERVIEWPGTTISVGKLDGHDLVLITGPEPNLKWRTYCAQIVSALRTTRPSVVVMLGALLADTPHTRPVPVSRSAGSKRTEHAYGLTRSSYEGPTGIVGVLSESCADAGFDVISLWAAVPHYVSHPPSPKASLALLQRLEDVCDITIPVQELPELCRAWERGVAELTDEDTDLADYVATLEADQDETELPEASGDAIAADFERYLRRHGH